MMEAKEELGSANQELAIRANEITYLKEALQSVKQDLANREIKLDETREEAKLSNQMNEGLNKDC